MFPKSATASVTGIGGMFGAIGGILIAKSAGKLFDYYKANGHVETGYLIMFLICSVVYILAWLIMHVLVPKMKKTEF
jgi:ACS family hexuronate transporter-like MFS transporter